MDIRPCPGILVTARRLLPLQYARGGIRSSIAVARAIGNGGYPNAYRQCIGLVTALKPVEIQRTIVEKKMLGEPHDLIHEFPEFKSRIDELRSSDAGFAQLMSEYDELDARIRGLEEIGQPVADETIEELKKQRVGLKDRLYARLRG
jgi:uncharacterized protein YdcH (DUF465 family)